MTEESKELARPNKPEKKEKKAKQPKSGLKSGKGLLIVIVGLIIGLVGGVILPYFFGYYFNIGYSYHEITEYQHDDPVFSFKYDAAEFEIDDDGENKYGDSYLVGVKVINDERTGCDVRLFENSLNLDRPIEEITSELNEDLGSGSPSFQNVSSDFVDFSGKRAVDMDIKFLGPIGDKAQIRQVFVPAGEQTYSIICGGNESLQKYYQKDYDHFFKSFSFE